MTVGAVLGAPAQAVTPAPQRVPRRPLRLLHAWPSLLGLALLAALWEGVTRGGLVSPSLVPPLTTTLAELGRLLHDPGVWTALGTTVRSWALGLALSVVVAVPLGMLLGTSDVAYRFARVPLEALRPVPPVVVLPLALLVLGGGTTFKVVLIAQGATWPLLVQTVYAVRAADPVALDTARSFRLGLARRVLQVRLPGAAPLIASGLRLAAATAFAVCIVTELVGGASGIGQALLLAQSGDDLPRVYALTVLVGLCGLLISLGLSAVERRTLAWVPGRSG